MNEPRRIHPNSFEALADAEKAAAMRAQLYATHKAHGTLGMYYQLYPEDAPRVRQRDKAREMEK